jgi:hypothetical protein
LFDVPELPAVLVLFPLLQAAAANSVAANAGIKSSDLRLVFVDIDTPFMDSFDGGIMRHNVCGVKCLS